MQLTVNALENLILLRRQIEHDTGQSIHHLNLNAAALLDDFCRAVELNDAQIRYILGSGYDDVGPIEDCPCEPLPKVIKRLYTLTH